MTDEIINTISSHSVIGAGVAAILALGYKVVRVLKSDRKEDSLDNAERSFRDEMRAEIKELREINSRLHKEKFECEQMITDLQARLQWLEQCFSHCKMFRPNDCPFLDHLDDPRHSYAGQDRRIVAERRQSRITPDTQEETTRNV